MPTHERTPGASRRYTPSMTEDYSRLSDTARAVERHVLPRIASHLASIHPIIARMPDASPFVIADYGAADGVNSSRLFERIVRFVHEANPSLKVRLVYIDIADPAPFYRFWSGSRLSLLPNVEAEYIRRSFYEPFPELAGRVRIGFSSTALHWLDTATVAADLFAHPTCIQPNQVPEPERRVFVERWRRDWRTFFRERAVELVDGGLLSLAALTSLGGDQWPASAAYDHLRDVCASLHEEGRLSDEELRAIFIPDYFATPGEMRDLLGEHAVGRHFELRPHRTISVPCAYLARMDGMLEDPGQRRRLAVTLAQVVRAWSESSIRVGLSPGRAALIDEIYDRLADRLAAKPVGLPYQYCLLELERSDRSEK